jgi:hypothetical protein
VIEQHLHLLIREVDTKASSIPPEKEYRHRGDFYGLLAELGIEPELHWVNLRVNGMHSPTDYDGMNYNIRIIRSTLLGKLLNKWNSSTGFV